MLYMLDTDTCIYLIKRKLKQVERRFDTLTQGDDVCLSSVTASELFAGVEKSALPEQNREALERFITPLDILDYGVEEAKIYGRIRANLEKAGMPIGPYDMMIAAHAIRWGCTLVTNNTREFQRIPNLRIENWAE